MPMNAKCAEVESNSCLIRTVYGNEIYCLKELMIGEQQQKLQLSHTHTQNQKLSNRMENAVITAK